MRLAGLLPLVTLAAACSQSPPRVDVALDGPVLDPALAADGPDIEGGRRRAEIRTVASAAPEAPLIDTGVPSGACGARAAPAVRESRLLTELEALPMILRRILKKDVERCIREAHDRDAAMAGLLILAFRLMPGGGIERTRVTAGAGDEALHRCVEAAFDDAETPEILVGGITRFPIVFCEDGRAEWRELGTFR